MRRNAIACLLAAALLALPYAAQAEDYVIIVNKDNGNAVDKDFAAKAYRGDVKSWAGGGNVACIALPDGNPVRAAFDKGALDKSPSQTRALWAQMAFSGKAVPPKIVDSEAEVIKAVSDNKNAIGYVSAGAAVASVKVVK